MAHIKCGGECPRYPAPPLPFINCGHFAKLLQTEDIYLVCALLISKEENGKKKDGKTGEPVPVICAPEKGLYVVLTGGRDEIQALHLSKEQDFVRARCHFSRRWGLLSLRQPIWKLPYRLKNLRKGFQRKQSEVCN